MLLCLILRSYSFLVPFISLLDQPFRYVRMLFFNLQLLFFLPSRAAYFQVFLCLFQMIKEATLALNEKNRWSLYAIADYMEKKHKTVLPANFKKILGI